MNVTAGEGTPPRVHPSPRDEQEIAGLAIGQGPLWVLAPGATYGPTKRWPSRSFAELGDRLTEEWGGHVVLVGARSDRATCADVREAMREPATNLAGETGIGTLVALFARSGLVVTNDSGAMHVASATGAKVVVLFGSTSPEWTGPRGSAAAVVRRHEPCAPCFQRRCAIGIVCLTRISVDEVFAACRTLREAAP
jgi:heptosyltransferase-2